MSLGPALDNEIKKCRPERWRLGMRENVLSSSLSSSMRGQRIQTDRSSRSGADESWTVLGERSFLIMALSLFHLRFVYIRTVLTKKNGDDKRMVIVLELYARPNTGKTLRCKSEISICPWMVELIKQFADLFSLSLCNDVCPDSSLTSSSSGNDLFRWKAERVRRLINSCLHDHSWIFHNAPAWTKLLDWARCVQRSGPSVIKLKGKKNNKLRSLYFFLYNFLWIIYGSSFEKKDEKVKRIHCSICVLRPWRRKRKKEREFERQICALLGQCVKRCCWSLR